ncbi:hypothetical protein KGM_210545 [Danaus plexippus plexippus]|uniref:Uncharacterized protein n=1 Tax=Danaus plexippus plexippus TaxID=278856 RepID=A0A212FCP8_DANPL|nr:hypothetical protein KGM_210545 [Danaus plexippus plexippus]
MEHATECIGGVLYNNIVNKESYRSSGHRMYLVVYVERDVTGRTGSSAATFTFFGLSIHQDLLTPLLSDRPMRLESCQDAPGCYGYREKKGNLMDSWRVSATCRV